MKVIETKAWVDESTQLPCLAVHLGYTSLPDDWTMSTEWWCGYVGISDKHPLFHKAYNEYVEKGEIRARNAWIPLFLHLFTIKEDKERVPIELLFDVHCGLTYSGGNPTKLEDDLWWFGFDCNHHEDHENPKDESFVINECVKLAEQLKEYFYETTNS